MVLPLWTPYPGYTRLSLKQIQDEFGCTIIVPTPYIEPSRPPITPRPYPPLPVSIGSVTITPSSFDENANNVGTVNYSINNRRDLTLYAFIHHINTNANDFDGDTRWTITADSGSFTFKIKTDQITELVPERFQIVISLDETYDGGFYVSDELSIADTSTYPRYNPRILPVSSATGIYLTTTGVPIDIKITDAAPNSTFTGKKTFTANVNFPVASPPWTPNPYLISIPQTISATGTWSDATYLYSPSGGYSVPGKYDYEFNFDNYAPAVLENGPNRFYQVIVNATLGVWKLYPDSVTKIGSNENYFEFRYEAPEKTDLKELSWFVVNKGTTTSYVGSGIDPNSLGRAYNIKRNDEVQRIGKFQIATTVVNSNQNFEVVLFSGELNQSTKLVQSVTCTVQVKPVIPDLIVTPLTQTKESGQPIIFMVSGSPDEEVEFAYVNENLNNPNYLHYFDYYGDVKHAFETNKFNDAEGKSREAYATEHYNNYGRKEGRKSNADLIALEKGIIVTKIKLLASQSTVSLRGNASINFTSVGFSNNLLPRETKYKFAVVGDKAPNTRGSSIKIDFLINYEPRLFITGSCPVPLGSPIKVNVFTTRKKVKITWTGATQGAAYTDDGGYLSVDIAFGATLSTNVDLNWLFNAEGVTKDVNLPYKCKIIESTFLVVDKTTSKADWQTQLLTNSADNKTYNITVILVGNASGTQRTISNKNISWAVRASDNISATVKTNGVPQIIQFDANNNNKEWPMPYTIGNTRQSTTQDILEITSSASTATLTIKITYQVYYESYIYGPTGGTIDDKPKEVRAGTEVTFRLTGGFPLSPVVTTWTHSPISGAVQVNQGPNNQPNQGTVNLNSSGGWNTTNSEVKITYVQPGTYTYTSVFIATGNRFTLSVTVKKPYVFSVKLEKTGTTTGRFINNAPIIARITGNPKETIKISAPAWIYKPFMFGCDSRVIDPGGNSEPTTFRGLVAENQYTYYEGMDRRSLVADYPESNFTADQSNAKYLELYPDVAGDEEFKKNPRGHYNTYGYNEGRMWPSNRGFSARTVTLDDNGEGSINLNGERNKAIFVQSTNYWRTTDTNTSFVVVGGQLYSTGNRGHTLSIFNPTDLTFRFQKNYDTYGDERDQNVNNLIADLRKATQGDLVIINSFDAFNSPWRLCEAIYEVFKSWPNHFTLPEKQANPRDEVFNYWTWDTNDIYTARANWITVGFAHQSLLYWHIDRERALIYSAILGGAAEAQNYPFLASLNKPIYDNSGSVRYWKWPYLDGFAFKLDTTQNFVFPGTLAFIRQDFYKYYFEVSNTANTKITLSLEIERADKDYVSRLVLLDDPYRKGSEMNTTKNNNCPAEDAPALVVNIDDTDNGSRYGP
jgi:hypothetical protein